MFDIEYFLNQLMTRTAAAARVASSRDFGDSSQAVRRDLAFDRPLGNKETRADQRFVAGPVGTRGIAVLANRGKKRVAGQLRTMLVFRFKVRERPFQRIRILSDNGRVGSRDIYHPLT